ncbi:hypothetical protein DYH09_35815 [bacterium CPR1]|nr:hypothetical protein [bacterium CPR1]
MDIVKLDLVLADMLASSASARLEVPEDARGVGHATHEQQRALLELALELEGHVGLTQLVLGGPGSVGGGLVIGVPILFQADPVEGIRVGHGLEDAGVLQGQVHEVQRDIALESRASCFGEGIAGVHGHELGSLLASIHQHREEPAGRRGWPAAPPGRTPSGSGRPERSGLYRA